LAFIYFFKTIAMLENLLDLIKQNAGETIINNPAIPNEKNEAVMEEAGSSIFSGLQGMLSQGNAKDVLSMFSNPENVSAGNPAVQHLSGGFLDSLVNKFGIDKSKAAGIAGTLIPLVLGQLVSRTNNSGDNGFNIQNIFNQLSGGKTGGMDIQSMLGSLTQGGLDKDRDGDVDLQDLTAMFSGGGGGTTAGMMDTIKGMLNK
jgi:hypothetical protein